jgi:hypothetical protein
MASMKMLLIAGALTSAWAGVAAVCFASIATVPANLVAIDHGRVAPAPKAPLAPQAPVMSVAQAERTSSGR